jgi:uncharacterized MAPEG superfamily protein
VSTAFWCVFCAGAIPYLLLFLTGLPARHHASRWGAGYDNSDPRKSADRLAGWRRRAHQAQLNSYESFGPFAAAVIIAQVQRGPLMLIDMLAVAYVALRLIYSTFYIADLSSARSTVWAFAMGLILVLFAVAGGIL